MMQSEQSIKNILTIDLEDWFHINYEEVRQDCTHAENRVVDNTTRLLNLLDEHNARATFFVLGCVAEKFPDLVLEVCKRGHEIASHGYLHNMVNKITREEFRYDLQKSVNILENITNTKVRGYRAPSWSINETNFWALQILDDLGFIYDSSIFPFKTYLYGTNTVPRFKYKFAYSGKKLNIYEIPPSTVRFAKYNIPFSGGFYFRVLPFWFISNGIKKMNSEGHPAILYLHPREIDINQPELKLGIKESLIHKIGIKDCEKKLSCVLKQFKFNSIQKYYNWSAMGDLEAEKL